MAPAPAPGVAHLRDNEQVCDDDVRNFRQAVSSCEQFKACKPTRAMWVPAARARALCLG
ncbi:hypothetical protein E4U42_007118, partial [Claviceps africana]